MTSSKLKLIQQGAEAKIFLELNKKEIIKERIKKSYRIKELDDKIRKQRTKTEKKLLVKAFHLINSPSPFESPFAENKEEYKIKMPYIEGKKLSECLDILPLNEQKKICEEVGKMIARLHENKIIHGDLTTSNMILQEKTNEIYFIDFGLGFFSDRLEDKAVDLHLLNQALNSKHFTNAKDLFQSVIRGYRVYSKSQQVLEKLKKVESRGRYKEKY